jgi:hypothetical protein
MIILPASCCELAYKMQGREDLPHERDVEGSVLKTQLSTHPTPVVFNLQHV